MAEIKIKIVWNVTEADLAVLDAQSPETLARWACVLNTWGWPEELPNCEPPPTGKPLLPKMRRRTALIGEITDRVGTKKISEEWNCRFKKHRLMTVEEHEAWWANNA